MLSCRQLWTQLALAMCTSQALACAHVTYHAATDFLRDSNAALACHGQTGTKQLLYCFGAVLSFSCSYKCWEGVAGCCGQAVEPWRCTTFWMVCVSAPHSSDPSEACQARCYRVAWRCKEQLFATGWW